MGEFRNALVVTFDTADGTGEETRGALVVEDLEELHGSIGKWMVANAPYIAVVRPIERSLDTGSPIQMMLCGTVERMRRAEARLLGDARVQGVGEADRAGVEIALNRTEYPERDLSILDILPAGCSKGVALLRLAERWGIEPDEMMAIGDNWNDLSMLEVAGRPVLMGNAPEELKSMAACAGGRSRRETMRTGWRGQSSGRSFGRAPPRLTMRLSPRLWCRTFPKVEMRPRTCGIEEWKGMRPLRMGLGGGWM